MTPYEKAIIWSKIELTTDDLRLASRYHDTQKAKDALARLSVLIVSLPEKEAEIGKIP